MDLDKQKSIHLEKYKEKYEKFPITDKQVKFIETLGGNLEVVSHIMKRKINKWDDLNHTDVTKCILTLKNRQPASLGQKELIRSLFSSEEIKNLLKVDIDTLNKGHIKQLLTNVDGFNIKYVDYPIESNTDYEYGYQLSDVCVDGKMYYLKFYNLLMIDYDGICYDELIKRLEPYREHHLFRIYQTHNGYHVFIVSATYEHKDYLTVEFMKSLKCDLFYILFSYKNGYKIRLSKKIGRNESHIALFIEEYGNADIDPECDKLMKIHDKFMDEIN